MTSSNKTTVDSNDINNITSPNSTSQAHDTKPLKKWKQSVNKRRNSHSNRIDSLQRDVDESHGDSTDSPQHRIQRNSHLQGSSVKNKWPHKTRNSHLPGYYVKKRRRNTGTTMANMKTSTTGKKRPALTRNESKPAIKNNNEEEEVTTIEGSTETPTDNMESNKIECPAASSWKIHTPQDVMTVNHHGKRLVTALLNLITTHLSTCSRKIARRDDFQSSRQALRHRLPATLHDPPFFLTSHPSSTLPTVSDSTNSFLRRNQTLTFSQSSSEDIMKEMCDLKHLLYVHGAVSPKGVITVSTRRLSSQSSYPQSCH